MKPNEDLPGKPNVIVFFTDQQRWDTTGLHGNPLGITPNFDRIARRGTHLYNMFTCQPVCGPARSCMQTGKYATATGCFRNGIPLPEGTKTLAHYFNQAGYHTGYIGKWHLANEEPVPPSKQGGYRYWLGSDLLEYASDTYHAVLYTKEQKPVKLPGYRVDALTDAAIRFIDAEQHRPFFLFVSYLEPHHQNHLDDYPPPDGYREPYTARWIPPDLAHFTGSAHQHLGGYYGMVKRLDEAFGRVMDALKSLQLLDNTIVLFTSDHGNHFKTRNQEYKRSCHESSIRVPALLTGPGFSEGKEIRELVSLIDIPPTLLDAAGIPVPPDMQGRSIVPLVRGDDSAWPDDVFVQISESQVGRAVRTKRWKYGVTAPGLDGKASASSSRYVEQYLYDVQSDPYEISNLIESEAHKEVAQHLKSRLIKRMTAAGEAQPVIDSVGRHEKLLQRCVQPEEIAQ